MNLQDTIEFAFGAHYGQFRKHSGLPYIVHPIAVLNLVSSWGITKDFILNACVVHDVLEDCDSQFVKELPKIVDNTTLSVVEELTCTGNKQIYLDSFKDKTSAALIIKIADRICNTLDFYNEDSRYAKIYWDKAKKLLDVFENYHELMVQDFGDMAVNRIRQSINNVEIMK